MFVLKDALITLGFITLFSISMGISLRRISQEILFFIPQRAEVGSIYSKLSWAFLILPLTAIVLDLVVISHNVFIWHEGRVLPFTQKILFFIFPNFDFNLASVVSMSTLNFLHIVIIGLWNVPLNRLLARRQKDVLSRIEANASGEPAQSKFIHYF